MADFQAIKNQLNDKRQTLEKLRLDLFHAQQQLRQLEEAQAQLKRRFSPDNPQQESERNKLEEQVKHAQALAEGLKGRYASVDKDLSTSWEVFAPLTDPRERIQSFSTNYPILLFPLRLETRFKTVVNDNRELHQLWVRVYPDDCLIDSFEATLSETEIANLQLYWAGIWNAGGNENMRRGVWRNLVSSHGAGRATYLIEQYTPSPESDPEPVRTEADLNKIILVVPTEAPLNDPNEKSALKTYWSKVWRANGEGITIQNAFNALVGAVGAARAQELNEQQLPYNLSALVSPTINRETAVVDVIWVAFPPKASIPSKTASWTQAAKVQVLPERLVLVADSGSDHLEIVGNPIISPLVVSPDPLEDQDKQVRLDENGNLILPDYLKWTTDFDEAVRVGMGFRVNLSVEQARRGFDRLYVMGVRVSADESKGKELLEDLLLHHQQSSGGLALIPQGTPTNNTEEESAGFSSSVDADVSFDLLNKIRIEGQQFDESENNELLKKDGLWLADYLGINPSLLQKTPYAAGQDQCEARAMNRALFPATLGYWLDTQMLPVFDEATIIRIRNFFNSYVLGRGAIPALRIGKQPYGLITATRFSALDWITAPDLTPGTSVPVENPERRFLRQLYSLLRQVDELYWKNFAANAPHVGQNSSNPQQLLLDIVGLHPASVEFHQQWAEGLDHLWNRLQFLHFMPWLPQWQQLMNLLVGGPALLNQLGYKGDKTPELLEKIFIDNPNLLKGPVVDQDPPLSETIPLSVVTADGKNYIEWLIDKASTNMDDLRAQRGFADNKTPIALLYLKLKHALELGYYDLGLELHRRAQLISAETYQTIRQEPSFVHVAQEAKTTSSRYGLLYKNEPRITGDDNLTVAEYIPKVLWQLQFNHYLPQQIEALKHLAKTPTARLERVFAEHIDTCTYRWDAWMMGLAQYRLRRMRERNVTGGENQAQKGIYLGAFGWVEDLRPDNRNLSPVQLSDDLSKIFNQPGEPTLLQDSQNGGYIHTPSLNHAVTAAILRNGFIHNSTPSEPDLLAVNLSSERVRRATQFIQGIREGQSLGALLGYQFERALHDRYNEAEVDQFIFDIRKAFPLRSRRIKDTLPDEDEPIENIEARNVVDGLLLLDHIKTSSVKTYPWGKTLQRGTAAQEGIINQEVNRLLDTQDAIADLAISESVHQAVQGNYDRAAATLDAYSRTTFPPQPEVALTPRSGVTLTHRVGLHLPSGAVPGANPRSMAEPALNHWLTSVLPPLGDIQVKVTYTDPLTNTPQDDFIAWSDLGLEPLDMLYILNVDEAQTMAEVDDRVYWFVLQKHNLRPDAEIKLQFTAPITGKSTFFEVHALVRSLRELILRSRPLKPGDVAMPNEAKSAAEGDVFVPDAQITAARASVDAVNLTANSLSTTLEPLAATNPDTTTEPDWTNLLGQTDALFNAFAGLQLEAGKTGFKLSGFGWAMNWRKLFFSSILEQAKTLGANYLEKSNAYTQLILDSAAPALDVDAQFELLQTAERLISTAYTLPLPATPDDFRTLLQGKKNNFDALLNQIVALQASTAKTINGLLAEWEAILVQLPQYDLKPLEVQAERKKVLVFVQDLYSQAHSLLLESQKRLTTGDEKIAAAAGLSGEKKAQTLREAAKAFLSDEFHLCWHFTLRNEQAAEWQNAWNDRLNLTSWLESQDIDFPVDEWLYGVARVRGKMHAWENITQLTGAFDLLEPNLVPLQFPYTPGEPWLALDFPATFDAQKTGDRLLYTACYGNGGFVQNEVQCGLLLDEWTEILPGKEETTGLAFHYDRPNNEAPQSLMLVVPASTGAQWTWDELKASVLETFEMAKKRASEPRNIEQTPLSRFLPATIAAVTLRGISISENLAVNNKFASFIKTDLSNG